MISKYLTYIKENNTLEENFQKASSIIKSIIIKLNEDYNIDNRDFFKYENDFYQNNNYYTIKTKFMVFAFVKLTNENIKITRVSDFNDERNKDNYFLSYTEDNLFDKIKEKLLSCFIINIIEINSTEDIMNKYINNLNLKKSLDNIINIVMNTDLQNFIYLLKSHFLPNYLINKYSYLLNANKFDLI